MGSCLLWRRVQQSIKLSMLVYSSQLATKKEHTMSSKLNVVLEPGIAQKLQFAINRNNGSLPDVDWLSHGNNFKIVSAMRKREAELARGTKVCIDRFVQPNYPEWVKKVWNPELENHGPAEYDLAVNVKLWVSEKQETDQVESHDLYQELEVKGMLTHCLGLRDLEQIQKKGLKTFQRFFGKKHVYAWKSVCSDASGNNFVPLLEEPVGEPRIELRWSKLIWMVSNDRPALMFT